MSVDKFGRHVSGLHRENVKGVRGEGFKLTEGGHYDMQQKLLRNVANPQQNSDVATKQYVDLNITKQDAETWEFQNKRLVNIAEPIEKSDAASKQYVDINVPEQNVDFWKFHGKRLSNIGDPVYDGESVNLRYLKKVSIVLSETDSDFDMRSKRLKRVKEPLDEDDAVTLKHMKTYSNQVVSRLSEQMSTTSNITSSRLTEMEEKITQHNIRLKIMIKRLGMEIHKFIEKKALTSENENPQNYINWDSVFDTPL